MIKRKSALFLAAALVTALAAAGCNLNNTQPPHVATATGETTEAPQPTATATVMPTATIAPMLTLKQGDSALLNGRFEDAAAAYSILVNQIGAPSEDRAAAG